MPPRTLSFGEPVDHTVLLPNLKMLAQKFFTLKGRFSKFEGTVLKIGGIVLAKIADIVHNHHYQWQQVDFINAVREVGMTPCDMMIKCDPCAGSLQSSKWNNVKHLRKAHCYWIVVRNSKRCEVKKNE